MPEFIDPVLVKTGSIISGTLVPLAGNSIMNGPIIYSWGSEPGGKFFPSMFVYYLTEITVKCQYFDIDFKKSFLLLIIKIVPVTSRCFLNKILGSLVLKKSLVLTANSRFSSHLLLL